MNTEYQRGFIDGEAQCFKDRRCLVRRELPPKASSEYGRGYLDGYTPRSLAWAATGLQSPPQWWQDRVNPD